MAHMEGTINLEMMFLKNGYRLGDKLGKGSFAVVKKAVHLPTGRDLAVKIVDHNLATKEFLEKFLSREMNIIGGLKHPNIIDVEKVRPFAQKLPRHCSCEKNIPSLRVCTGAQKMDTAPIYKRLDHFARFWYTTTPFF